LRGAILPPAAERAGRYAARYRFSLDGVLRFWDDRTGSYAELAANPSIPLRVCIHGPSDRGWAGLADLRVLLVAEVLTRTAEVQGLQVIAVLATAGRFPARSTRTPARSASIGPPCALAPGMRKHHSAGQPMCT